MFLVFAACLVNYCKTKNTFITFDCQSWDLRWIEDNVELSTAIRDYEQQIVTIAEEL